MAFHRYTRLTKVVVGTVEPLGDSVPIYDRVDRCDDVAGKRGGSVSIKTARHCDLTQGELSSCVPPC